MENCEESEFIEVPIFSGDNINDWIANMEAVMNVFEVPTIQKVNFAYMYVEGSARDWVRLHLDQVNWWTWSQFTAALCAAFLVCESIDETKDLIQETKDTEPVMEEHYESESSSSNSNSDGGRRTKDIPADVVVTSKERVSVNAYGMKRLSDIAKDMHLLNLLESEFQSNKCRYLTQFQYSTLVHTSIIIWVFKFYVKITLLWYGHKGCVRQLFDEMLDRDGCSSICTRCRYGPFEWVIATCRPMGLQEYVSMKEILMLCVMLFISDEQLCIGSVKMKILSEIVAQYISLPYVPSFWVVNTFSMHGPQLEEVVITGITVTISMCDKELLNIACNGLRVIIRLRVKTFQYSSTRLDKTGLTLNVVLRNTQEDLFTMPLCYPTESSYFNVVYVAGTNIIARKDYIIMSDLDTFRCFEHSAVVYRSVMAIYSHCSRRIREHIFSSHTRIGGRHHSVFKIGRDVISASLLNEVCLLCKFFHPVTRILTARLNYVVVDDPYCECRQSRKIVELPLHPNISKMVEFPRRAVLPVEVDVYVLLVVTLRQNFKAISKHIQVVLYNWHSQNSRSFTVICDYWKRLFCCGADFIMFCIQQTFPVVLYNLIAKGFGTRKMKLTDSTLKSFASMHVGSLVLAYMSSFRRFHDHPFSINEGQFYNCLAFKGGTRTLELSPQLPSNIRRHSYYYSLALLKLLKREGAAVLMDVLEHTHSQLAITLLGDFSLSDAVVVFLWLIPWSALGESLVGKFVRGTKLLSQLLSRLHSTFTVRNFMHHIPQHITVEIRIKESGQIKISITESLSSGHTKLTDASYFMVWRIDEVEIGTLLLYSSITQNLLISAKAAFQGLVNTDCKFLFFVLHYISTITCCKRVSTVLILWSELSRQYVAVMFFVWVSVWSHNFSTSQSGSHPTMLKTLVTQRGIYVGLETTIAKIQFSLPYGDVRIVCGNVAESMLGPCCGSGSLPMLSLRTRMSKRGGHCHVPGP